MSTAKAWCGGLHQRCCAVQTCFSCAVRWLHGAVELNQTIQRPSRATVPRWCMRLWCLAPPKALSAGALELFRGVPICLVRAVA